MPQITHTKAPRLLELDLLRPVAALMVVASHHMASANAKDRFSIAFGSISNWGDPVASVAYLGQLGVDIFFMISGGDRPVRCGTCRHSVHRFAAVRPLLHRGRRAVPHRQDRAGHAGLRPVGRSGGPDVHQDGATDSPLVSDHGCFVERTSVHHHASRSCAVPDRLVRRGAVHRADAGPAHPSRTFSSSTPDGRIGRRKIAWLT